MSVWLNNFKD